MSEVTVSTPCGVLKGLEENGVRRFRGVRYASAKRWEYPKLTERWDGVYDATRFGACCWQRRAFCDESSSENSFYHNEFRRGLSFFYDEDCLFLNISAPAGGEDCPVVVLIHGGSFTRGSGDELYLETSALARRGVVLVTINYRLGVFGFFASKELEEQAGHSGNYALYDQLAAIRWVRENIEAFGGDAQRITVMGQSAGAMCVQALCLSPERGELFSSAVMLSGAGLLRGALAPIGKAKLEQKYGKMANGRSLEQLRALPPEELYALWDEACREKKLDMRCAMPCIDGRLLTEAPTSLAEAGMLRELRLVCGMTADDMFPFVLYKLMLSLANGQHRRGSLPCYLYYFDKALPGDANGAWHAADQWYIFGSMERSWRPFDEGDRELSEKMLDALCSFARGDAPQADGLGEWEPACGQRKAFMRFGEHCSMFSPSPIELLRKTAAGTDPKVR